MNPKTDKPLPLTHIVTPPVRLAFPALFKPRPRMMVPGGVARVGDDGKPVPVEMTYQAVLLLPPDLSLKPFGEALKHAMLAKWGKAIPLTPATNPVHSCEEKEGRAGFLPGWHFINLHSKVQPIVVDQRKQTILDDQTIYAGCWVHAHINAFAWSYGAKKGVSFGLNALQLVRQDERLDGRVASADVFGSLEDQDLSSPDGDASDLF